MLKVREKNHYWQLESLTCEEMLNIFVWLLIIANDPERIGKLHNKLQLSESISFIERATNAMMLRITIMTWKIVVN